ncbi:Mitochondrial import inner membrane translocase subunit TIM50 [Phytophthora pseudosyringae]|uniref:Mitochondrial import inner membrane translocase subunit TIM50 n=1 Tax=Phytophthora pseudosyringae TaxID=221518 RepID=A0A8T1VVT9_9STRA|nr:Mitochondrial import inner membrane translocase subunit TIM50 [Phytophthora pseudosyringae]
MRTSMSAELDSNEAKRPVLAPTISANDVSALLSMSASPSSAFERVRIGKCPPTPRSRRPRETITLTPTEMQTLSADEVRKRKNAIAAQRARDHKEQRTRDLEDMVRELWKRVQYLEAAIQALHPNEFMDDLYSQYEPYAVSHTIRPLIRVGCEGEHSPPSSNMKELAWLLVGHSKRSDHNN